MNEKQKEFLENYNRQIHRLGRFTLIVSVVLLVGIPFSLVFYMTLCPLLPALLQALPKSRRFISRFPLRNF